MAEPRDYISMLPTESYLVVATTTSTWPLPVTSFLTPYPEQSLTPIIPKRKALGE